MNMKTFKQFLQYTNIQNSLLKHVNTFSLTDSFVPNVRLFSKCEKNEYFT